jgi:hypothetical protein
MDGNLLITAGDGKGVRELMDGERDWESEWYERMNDENFLEIRDKAWELLKKERGLEQAIRDNQNHRAAVETYDITKRLYFVNNVDDKTLDRARSGDTQAAEELAKQMGIVDDLARKE